MERKDINKLSGELLKKSVLKPESPDFNDQLMKKIMVLPKHEFANANKKLFRNGWKFLVLALSLLLVSLTIISNLPMDTSEEISRLFVATRMYILYGGLALFVPLLFTQLDALLKMMFENRYHPRVNY